MNDHRFTRKLSRRRLLALGGGTLAAAAGARLLPTIRPFSVTPGGATGPSADVEAATLPTIEKHLAGTDGWVSLPGGTPNGAIYPDSLAPAGKTTYVFGFRDVTGLDNQTILAQKGKAQISAPLLYVDQEHDLKLTLTNLGLQQRPDLTDSHTVHFHGFRNAIPLFDGVPEMSIGVPIGSQFTYFYRLRDPGTYMYHCHYEDVEHVQMGMQGIIVVRPLKNQQTGQKYAYNDSDGSTRYDREFALFLSEISSEAHYDDAHIQLFDWSEYRPDFWLMNGRVYPDTLLPNGDPLAAANQGTPLQHQPISSLITANAGERVLLRFVNLGYQEHSMTLDGIPLHVVGKDATLLRGRTGADTSATTNTIQIGPGESYDAIFTAPAVTTQSTWLLYNRKYAYQTNGGASGQGGQMTEVRVSPAGTLPPQTAPNY